MFENSFISRVMARLIIGHTTDTTVKIWFRASSRWPVAFIEVLDATDQPIGSNPNPPVVTVEEDFFTGVVEWTGLAPGQSYRVKVAFGKAKNSKPHERVRDAYTEGRFTTFPAAGTGTPFTFMLGSCNLHSLGIFEKPDRAWSQVSAVARQNSARFMIHAGDQIYADIPLRPSASLEHYRDKYLDAWGDCVPARKVLTELPHYMILDDHEITNDFANDMDLGERDPQALARIAMKVYWEFQHSHNPQSSLPGYHYHYEFSFGDTRFFVMDTRFHRFIKTGQIIAPEQEGDLLAWLDRYPLDLKFIVTSVPFITEVKSPSDDKWTSAAFRAQRSRILAHIVGKGITRIVFLTGDMHAAMHSTMELTDSHGNKAVLHELMASPINQITPDMELDRTFYPDIQTSLDLGLAARTRIDPASYYGNHSNVMAVEVTGDGKLKYRIYRTSKDKLTPERQKTVAV